MQGQLEFVEAMNEILFPNRSSSMFPFRRKKAQLDSNELQQKRLLQNDDAYTEEVPCVICRDMEYCSALNGLQIEEVYLPNNLNDMGTCRVLDELGSKVKSEVFGNGRSFRDTTQCNDIVMQYLCLFYGSDNDMYRNHCIYQEDVSDSNPVNHKVALDHLVAAFVSKLQKSALTTRNSYSFVTISNVLQWRTVALLILVSKARY